MDEMKRIIKSFYILIVALIVFMGGLLIWQGMTLPREMPVQSEEAESRRFEFPPVLFYFQKGSAL